MSYAGEEAGSTDPLSPGDGDAERQQKPARRCKHSLAGSFWSKQGGRAEVVGEKRYWFEDVPEEGRYWTVARVGVSQNRAAQEPSARESASVFSEGAEEVEQVMRRGLEIGFVPT